MDKITKIIYGIMFLSLISLAASLLYLLSVYQTETPIAPQTDLRYNVSYLNNKDGMLRYYTGNTFVSYNPQKNTSTPLTNRYLIYGALDVYWLDNGVVFTTQDYKPYGRTYQDMARIEPKIQNLEPIDGQIYWYLSFQDNSLNRLTTDQYNEGILGVTSDKGLVFRDADRQYSLLSNDGTIARNVIPSTSATMRVISLKENTYYYTELVNNQTAVKRGTIGSDKKETVIEKLRTDAMNVFFDTVAIDSSHIYFTERRNDATHLATINLKTRKRTTLDENFTGTLAQQSPSFIFTQKAIHGGFNVTSLRGGEKIDSVNISAPFTIVGGITQAPRGYYFNSNLGVLRYAGNDTQHAKSLQPGYRKPLEKELSMDDVAIERLIASGYDNLYSLTFIDGTSEERIKQVYSAVSKKGIDPYQFTFEINPGPNVEN